MQIREIPKAGVTAPQGFSASALSCGIKDPSSSKLDLALLHSKAPAAVAATFTTNRVQAAPVRLCREHLRGRPGIRALIVNSGNANACNGPQGMEDARVMAAETARALELDSARRVLVASTGVIGTPMPMNRITPRIGELVADLKPTRLHGQKAAEAIMTSDTFAKTRAVEWNVGRKAVRIGAMVKGAGMIDPDMATMLCFITTDAVIERLELRVATREAVRHSFNCISIDGDMSTNDTVLVMANGAAGNPPIKAGSPAARRFREALQEVMFSLAKMIVRDAERATKFVELEVVNARNETDARKAAKAVANSLLVKCAWNGSRAYWGRIMDALGYSGAFMQEEKIDIYYNGKIAARSGAAAKGASPAKLHSITAKKEFTVRIDLNAGGASHTVYTSDISEGFVEYNTRE